MVSLCYFYVLHVVGSGEIEFSSWFHHYLYCFFLGYFLVFLFVYSMLVSLYCFIFGEGKISLNFPWSSTFSSIIFLNVATKRFLYDSCGCLISLGDCILQASVSWQGSRLSLAGIIFQM